MFHLNSHKKKSARIKTYCFYLVFIIFTACSTTKYNYKLGEEHFVRSGETLYVIAWRYGKNYKDLILWNNIKDGSLIYSGQVIKLTAPENSSKITKKKTKKKINSSSVPDNPISLMNWDWPTKGSIVSSFSKNQGARTGILIGGKIGQPIVAVKDGQVVYSGDQLIGYGNLVIIKHSDEFMSAYGHNASVLVVEGEMIRKGQKIATMGNDLTTQPRLHFEIRRNGNPINPLVYLKQ